MSSSKQQPSCTWTSSKNIAQLRLYYPSPLYTRMDLIPFLLLYAFDYNVYFSPQIYKEFAQSLMDVYVPDYAHWNFQVYAWSLIGCWMVIITAFFHVIVSLLEYWHLHIRCRVQYTEVQSVESASLAHVIPPVHCGEDALCPIRVNPTTKELYFIFQQIKYTFVPDTDSFVELDFPITNPIEFYINSSSISFEDALSLQNIYDRNEFDIPMPNFLEIFQEHATAPFFIFQVFCVGLWMLDEYWMYSLFTLFMLVIFEMMMVKRRMGNMKMIRNMRSKPFYVYVYRERAWHRILTEDIVPSDLLSIVRNHKGMSEDPYEVPTQQTVVPCDVLLLTGTCVVDEALLTGESVPQIKEPVDISDPQTPLDLKGAHKISLISGGTKIVIANHSTAMDDNINQSNNNNNQNGNRNKNSNNKSKPNSSNSKNSTDWLYNDIPPPPNNGAIGWVLRTGFHTSQGELLRTILFSTSRVSVNNPEAFVFIAVLLCFAIVASGYVLYWGLQDETRSPYKLALNCVMIITSVVPPELPMELSMAVNNSMIKLLRLKIFCTEAFRIPFAGAVEICCFDKTGTLTSDQFQVVGLTKLNINPFVTEQLTMKHKQQSGGGGSSGGTTAATKTVAKKSSKGADDLTNIIIPNAKKFGFDGAVIVAGCHSLVRLDRSVIGDPLEKSALQAMGWSFTANIASPASYDAAAVGGGEHQSNNEIKSTSTKKTADAPVPEYPSVQIFHRFAFSSALKRMSCIVTVNKKRGTSLIRLVCKGAAEVIGERLKNMPMNYNTIHSYFSRQGFRVLALAWKPLSNSEHGISFQRLKDRRYMKSLQRNKLERDLIFAGFLVFACPHKPDSLDTIIQLKASSHAVCMITGDHVLTACAVARDLQIAVKPLLTLQQISPTAGTSAASGTLQNGIIRKGNNNEEKQIDNARNDHDEDDDVIPEFQWFDINSYYDNDSGRKGIALDFKSSADVKQLTREYDLCLSGKAIKHLRLLNARQVLEDTVLHTLLLHVVVYARTSPVQKEFILSTLKELGIVTLMCGDGTNDVGALKQAHVGVALLSAQAAHQVKKQEENRRKRIAQKKKNALRRWPGARDMMADDSDDENSKKKKASSKWDEEKPMSSADLQSKMWDQLLNGLDADADGEDGDIMEAKPVQLGDASIASPFTSKQSTIASTIHIIRQGRCTLVTTLQMYCILALNCLVSAYSLSVLYMEGVKYGDTQMTITGMMIAFLFFFVTQSEPTSYLSKQQPHTSVFSNYVVLSLIGQTITHLYVLMCAVKWSKPHTPTDEETKDPAGKFKPNVLNTVVFLISTVQTVATFTANYAGYPFMISLGNNKKLHRTILALLAVCFACGFGYWPAFDKLMQIAPLPSEEFRNDLLILMAADLCVVVGWERLCRYLFRRYPNPIVPLEPPSDEVLKAAMDRQRKKYLQERAVQQKRAAKNSPWNMMKKGMSKQQKKAAPAKKANNSQSQTQTRSQKNKRKNR